MLWIVRKKSFILALLLACSLAFSFISSSSVSATSQSITCDSNTYYQDCYKTFDSTNLGFTPLYLVVDVVNTSQLNINKNSMQSWLPSGTAYNVYIPFNDTGTFSALVYLPGGKVQMYSWSTWGSTYDSITFTFYDSWPIVPCSCPTCPEVPENPYDDKLDNINKSILICGAIMIFIYFMFCIYQCFFGGIKK